jgi:hypothetical protein
MNLNKRAVDLVRGIERGFAVRFQRIVVAQEQETASHKGWLIQGIELPLVISPKRINGFVHKGNDMEPVEDNFYVGQYFMNSPEAGATHARCHGFQLFPPPGQGFQEGTDVFFALSLDHLQDSASLEFGHHTVSAWAVFLEQCAGSAMMRSSKRSTPAGPPRPGPRSSIAGHPGDPHA